MSHLRNLLFFAFALIGGASYGQSEGYMIHFVPTFGGLPATLNQAYYLPTIDDSITIEHMRFYVSHLEVLKDGKVVGKLEDDCFLMDMVQPLSLGLGVDFRNKQSFNELRFNIGIDSLTNVSGAMGGALDPVNGMYWAWQSGFVNFKIEGTSRVCNTRNHKFQYHIGGYLPPYNALQKVSLPCIDDREMTVYIAIDKIIAALDLKAEPEIMSPGAKAVNVATIIKQNFTTNIKP
jgi:hypothetical protein